MLIDNDDPWLLRFSLEEKSPANSAPVMTLFEGVAPLDAQFGQWPRKSIPDVLHEHVLGADGLQGYALVDAALLPDLEVRLARSGLPGSCLFDGAASGQLGAVAPWLVSLGEDDELTRSLFTRGRPNQSLWDAGAAVFIRSDMSLDDVRHQLRKLTQVPDKDGHWVFLRFWNPLFARYLLTYGSPYTRMRLLAAGPMMMRGADPDSFLIWSLPEEAHGRKPPSPFVLQPEDHHALRLATMDAFAGRVFDWLNSAYGSLPGSLDAQRFVLELCHHARARLGLRSEREVSDYIAASWLLREPAERRQDCRPLAHEIPQATWARIHDTAFEIARNQHPEAAE